MKKRHLKVVLLVPKVTCLCENENTSQKCQNVFLSSIEY